LGQFPHVGILWLGKVSDFDGLNSSKRAIRKPLYLKRQFPAPRRRALRLCAIRVPGTKAVRPLSRRRQPIAPFGD
jgi:hypothetical protein